MRTACTLPSQGIGAPCRFKVRGAVGGNAIQRKLAMATIFGEYIYCKDAPPPPHHSDADACIPQML